MRPASGEGDAAFGEQASEEADRELFDVAPAAGRPPSLQRCRVRVTGHPHGAVLDSGGGEQPCKLADLPGRDELVVATDRLERRRVAASDQIDR